MAKPEWTRRRRDLEDEATRILKQARANARAEKTAARRASQAQSKQEIRDVKREADRILKEAANSARKKTSSVRKTESNVKASLAYIAANAYRALAISECQSKTMREILRTRTKFPMKGQGWFTSLFKRKITISLKIPHYWAKFYHDGYVGGTFRGKVAKNRKKPWERWASSPRGVWLAFVFNGKSHGQDPRRPAKAIDEVLPKHYKKNMLKGQTKSFYRTLVKQFGKYMIFFHKRRGWPGDPFLDRARARLRTFLETEVAGKAIPGLVSATVDGLVGRTFGRQIRASSKVERLARFKDPYGLLHLTVTYRKTRTLTGIENFGALKGEVFGGAGGGEGIDL